MSGGEARRTGRVGGKGGEGWCRSSMPMRIDTLLSNRLHPHVWKVIRHEARRGYNTNVGARKPYRYHRVQCRQLHRLLCVLLELSVEPIML